MRTLNWMERQRIRRVLCGAALGLAASMTAGLAPAQEAYPDKPVRLIVPQPAGGTGDVVTRLVAQGLAARLGKPVVVENRPGAGGTIGTAFVAKSPADGYTLAMTSSGFSTYAELYPGLGFNPATEVTPVAMMAIVPVAAVVRGDAPYATLADLIAHIRKNPGKATFGSTGQGTLSHLMGAWFQAATGADVVHVPYNGAAPAVTALLGGQVDYMFDPMGSAALIKAGRVRALAVTDSKRSIFLPGVPAMSELDLPVRGAVWLAVMAPAGTPRAVLERLNREINAVLNDPTTQSALTAKGVQPDPMSIEEFSKFLEADMRNMGKLVRDNGIKIN